MNIQFIHWWGAYRLKSAMITGITGQDGSYLAELLLEKGYAVTGLIRHTTRPNTTLIQHLLDNPQYTERLTLVSADLTNDLALYKLLETVRPDELYHLASQSHVQVSYEHPIYTTEITGTATLRLLEAVRQLHLNTRFYNAASSEIFGQPTQYPQDENTPIQPQSPYGVAKALSYWVTRNYRDQYGLHASSGLLFNHESPRRSPLFVTRKITQGLARIVAGKQSVIELGNLSAKRDFGYAPDYVNAMWMMLQQPEPDDYVIATGKSHSVQDFIEYASQQVGLDWQDITVVSNQYKRPQDIGHLLGNAKKAQTVLGWQPTLSYTAMIDQMLAADLTAEGVTQHRAYTR